MQGTYQSMAHSLSRDSVPKQSPNYWKTFCSLQQNVLSRTETQRDISHSANGSEVISSINHGVLQSVPSPVTQTDLGTSDRHPSIQRMWTKVQANRDRISSLTTRRHVDHPQDLGVTLCPLGIGIVPWDSPPTPFHHSHGRFPLLVRMTSLWGILRIGGP